MESRHSSFSEREMPKRNYSYVSVLAIATIQILLSQLFLCYGILLLRFVLDDFYTLEDGLWTVVSYTAAKKFTRPLIRSYCKYAKRVRKNITQRNIIVATFLLSICLIGNSLANTRISQTILYGGACGFFVAIIQTHLKFYTVENYDTLELILEPVSLCFTPHLLLFLTDIYDAPHTEFIVSALILNVIPACMTIRNARDKDNHCTNRTLYKLPTFHKLPGELNSLSESREENSASSEEDDEDFDESGVRDESVGTDHDAAFYINPALLMKMLPDIPEENEPEDDADDINELTLQKFSRVKEHFHGANNHHRGSVNNYYDENMLETFSIISEQPAETIKKSRCFSVSSRTMYNLRMKRKETRNFLVENFLQPIPRTIVCLYFYPIVICNSVLSFLSPIFLATAPFIALEKSGTGAQNDWTIADSTFLLSIIGFAWAFFLIAYPILKRLSPFKKRLAFISGILITGSSFFVAQKFTNHHLTGSCLIFGFGHGIISFTESFAYKELCGEKKWKKLHGPVDICTAFLVILVYSVIYYLWNVRTILAYVHWPYVFCAGLWTFAHILKRTVVAVKNFNKYRKERFPRF